jgi:hypothetical protein
MKKLIINISIAVLLVVGIVFGINSCGDNSFTEFHIVSIPEYTDTDYIKLIDNKNDDIAYNAISNLIDKANEYGKIMSADTISDTLKYNIAKEAYNKVKSQLTSDDEWVLCAAIRFLTSFSREYKNQDEIIESLLSVSKMTKSIQLEIMDGFRYTSADKSEKYKEEIMKKVINFRNQKSWLLSRYSYQFSNKNKLANFLIENYRNTNEDFDKLLIIKSLSETLNDTIFSFLSNELVISSDKRIRQFIIKSLCKAQNTEVVINWIKTNYPALEKDKYEAFDFYSQQIDSKIGGQIILTLIENGFNPTQVLNDNKVPKLYQYLNEQLLSYRDKKLKNNIDSARLEQLKLFESALTKNNICSNDWLKFKDENKEPLFSAEMLAQYNAEKASLERKTKQLFSKYNIDYKHRDAFMRKAEEDNK